VLLGAPFEKFFFFFFDHAEIQENSTRELHAIRESAFQEAFQQWKKRFNDISPVEGTTLKGTVLKMSQNEAFIAKVRSFFEHALYSRRRHFALYRMLGSYQNRW
jgi:hypothetical protein